MGFGDTLQRLAGNVGNFIGRGGVAGELWDRVTPDSGMGRWVGDTARFVAGAPANALRLGSALARDDEEELGSIGRGWTGTAAGGAAIAGGSALLGGGAAAGAPTIAGSGTGWGMGANPTTYATVADAAAGIPAAGAAVGAAAGNGTGAALLNFIKSPGGGALLSGLAGAGADFYGARQQGRMMDEDRQMQIERERRQRDLNSRLLPMIMQQLPERR